jgi:cytidine deaminase
MDWAPLIAVARQARERAYAPYSHYLVGAALLAEDGTIYPGANVEYTIPALGLCAERSAMAGALTAGARSFKALAVVTVSSPPAAPCGLCRQTLLELADDLPILLTNLAGERVETRLKELLPRPFHLAPGSWAASKDS